MRSWGPLGAGGMGEVDRARDPKLNRAIAIKILPEATAADPDRRARFEREAQAIAVLNHPNIVTISRARGCGPGIRKGLRTAISSRPT
jgi:serine/threonine protein kinase